MTNLDDLLTGAYRMLNIKQTQNSGTVVGHSDITDIIDQHLV